MEIHADPVLLRVDESGAVRVGNTRVLFYLVVEAYKRGNGPEEIVSMYDTLTLADAHAAVAYYLRHREEVEAFLVEVEGRAQEIRRKIEANQPPQDELRAKLEARWALMEQKRAAPGQ